MLHTRVGENGDRFTEEWKSKPVTLTRTTCRNPKNAADSVGLISDQVTGSAAFIFSGLIPIPMADII